MTNENSINADSTTNLTSPVRYSKKQNHESEPDATEDSNNEDETEQWNDQTKEKNPLKSNSAKATKKKNKKENKDKEVWGHSKKNNNLQFIHNKYLF